MLQLLCRRLIISFLWLGAFTLAALAQDAERQARAAQWEAYALPAGEFTRLVNREKGYVVSYPSDWQDSPFGNGGHRFIEKVQKEDEPRGVLTVITEDIPDGYGLANYTSATLQGFRKLNVNEDTLIVRRVLSGGLEWREIVLEFEDSGTDIRQTMWMAVIGPRAYLFALAAVPEKHEALEPIFKRLIGSVMIGAAGHWDEQFEALRARFPKAEAEAVALATAIRTGREPLSAVLPRLQALAERAPAAVFDLCTDPDPIVRTVAVTVLGQVRNTQWPVPLPLDDALLWAASDKAATVSAAAARALLGRGANWLDAAKQQLHLLNDAGTAVRLGFALDNAKANELVAALWQSEDDKQQLAGLRLALTLPSLTAALPYAKLFNAKSTAALDAAIAVVERHRPADAFDGLTRLQGTPSELWAINALAAVAPLSSVEKYKARLAELDKKLEKNSPSLSFRAPTAPPKGRVRGRVVYTKPIPRGQEPPPPPPPPKALPSVEGASVAVTTAEAGNTPATFKDQPEIMQLAQLRGAYVSTIEKIEIRDRWEKAKDDAERRAILESVKDKAYDTTLWVRGALMLNYQWPALAKLDAAQLKDAPTTGETLFPARTGSYAMAPHFADTLDKLDAALAGVQMTTVRDQMNFALMLNIWKTLLGNEIGTPATGDLGLALGIDLRAPVAVASWTAESGYGLSHAVTLRVTERVRFERALMLELDKLGGLESFSFGTALLSRFAGIVPGAVPLLVALATSGALDPSDALEATLVTNRHLPPVTTMRQETLGDLSVTVFEQSQPYRFGGTRRVELHVVYLGTTALVTSSRVALIEALNAHAESKTIANSPAFARAKQTPGEIVFFSELGELLTDIFKTSAATDEEAKKSAADLQAFAESFGAESDALQLTPHSWETSFHLNLRDSDLLKALRPLAAADLAAPRELLPASTVLYAGVQCEPAQLWAALKKMSANSEAKKPKDQQAKVPTVTEDEALDQEFEQTVIPQLQGEIAAAVLSLQPLFATDSMRGEWPAMALAFKLKSNALATKFKLGKLFAKQPRLKGVTALGAPVIALGDKNDAPYLTVTNQYLLLADSVSSLERLSSAEKFAATRDYQRTLAASPGELAFFATYNIESAFNEAQERFAKDDENIRSMMPMLAAVSHAFHSQRLLFGFAPDGLTGKLAVSFDREGRYAVGAVANNNSAFDVANALIEPTGLNIAHPRRVEALSVRVLARQSGIAARVRDDLSKFKWQRIESNNAADNDTAVQFTSTARHIPDKLTIKLPVKLPAVAKYLEASPGLRTNDPQIIALAQQIADKDRDGRSVARKLGEWTFKNLKWKKVQSDVVQTLAAREADCLEHSELYVALARALGLPARVVTGAAFSGGSFGAHAWVEVYLGQWVELDPTWGLLDHVDATHLRFESNAFSGYAMLNQLAMEITGVKNATVAAQRDPLTLVRAFGEGGAQMDLAYDLALSAERALGAEAYAKLDEKQRAALGKAFDRLIGEFSAEVAEDEEEEEEDSEPPQILQSEVQGERATVTALNGYTRFRFHLAARQGAWYIVEIENLDKDLPLFADALEHAAHGAAPLRQLYAQSSEKAFKRVDDLLAAKETAALLMLKAYLHSNRATEALLKEEDKKKNKDEQKPKTPPSPSETQKLLRQIIARWPDFAPAHLMLGRELRPYPADDETPAEQARFKDESVQAVNSLKRYAELVPTDPRPWSEMAGIYENIERWDEAESAWRAAIARHTTSRSYPASLLALLLKRGQQDKAKAEMLALSKSLGSMQEAFGVLSDGILLYGEEEEHKALAAQVETLLSVFPKELATSRAGLQLLAEAQAKQKKTEAALKTRLRVIALGEPEAYDYFVTGELQRELKLLNEALASFTQTLKLDAEFTGAYFQRACVYAQLGRQREAITDLQKLPTENEYLMKKLDDEALAPLAELPEFKALRAKKPQ